MLSNLSATLGGPGGAAEWHPDAIPNCTGKTAVVTGSNVGIGYEVAKELATHGARVIIAGRSASKVAEAVARLKACRPTATVEGYTLDLASFSSIEAFVKTLKDTAKLKALHVLVNNAGVCAPPHGKTTEGFDTQIGTNHVGHVYLTQLLLPLLKAGKPSRVVVVSSALSSSVNEPLPWDDLGGAALTESGMGIYGLSKLYNCLHAMELQKRYKDVGIEAFAVHPGTFVASDIQNKMDTEHWSMKAFATLVLAPMNTMMGVPASDGARPALFAATATELAGRGGAMFGPNMLNLGWTSEWKPTTAALTVENATRLLDETLKLITAKGGKPDVK